MPQFVYQNSNEKKRQLAFDPDTDYDFLRIEVQVKKSKLNTLVRKHSLNGRELQYLVIPEVEQYVLDYYVNKLTGTGLYVTYDRAMKMIDESGYTKPKKERLKKIIEAVAKKHGIAKVLEQIEKGTITDLGTLKTVKRYLKEIETLGINPVTIPANRRRDNMNIEDIQSLYRTAKIKWSTHCLERMQERDIGIEDVGNCIMSGEIIEDYPDDFPHPSCLIFGYTIHHKVVLHTVVGSDGEVLYIITAYYPNTKKFMEDLKTRRNQ